MRIPWAGRGSPPGGRRKWRLLLVPAMGLAVICQLSLTGAAGASTITTTAKAATSGGVAPNPVNELDCNGWSHAYGTVRKFAGELCTDPIKVINGKATRFSDNNWYVGHDEPSVKFISSAPGSGNTMSYLMKLSRDPVAAPTSTGSVTDYAQLSPAPWFGLPICDPNSFPQNACTPDSDTNDPNVAGSAFMELQFYPPGFTPFIDNVSCSATKWCAALNIDSLECSQGGFAPGGCNQNCTEPVNFAFIQTSAGLVAIDAATSPDRVRTAMADLGLTGQAPVSHLILTHAHLDHTGGSDAVRGPGTQVIASAGFPAEAERQRHVPLPPFRYLTGTEIFEDPGASPAFDVQPDRLISERTSVVVGGTEFVLIPVRGGETPDALMVYLPASGLLFTGDVMMQYLGIPFTAEGSPEGLLDTLRYIRELAPRQLIQGHTTLTENFTIEALTGLEPALTELHEFALAKIGENMPLPNILDLGYLPAVLRDHPAAVVPYLVTRDDFIARLYHQRTGYWQPDGQGLDPRSAEETAAALDLLAGEKADAFVTAAATLAGQGDLALALDILTPGLLRHPDSSELAELRQAVVIRLMEQRQLSDPFGFVFYAELAGAELPPVG